MRLLGDTHIFLWIAEDSPRITHDLRTRIEGAGVRYVSLVSAWEVAIKIGLRKLHFPVPFEPTIAAYGFQPLLISFDHVAAVSALPHHHRDPFDRLLIAQAQLEGLTIVSADRHFGLYGVPLVAM